MQASCTLHVCDSSPVCSTMVHATTNSTTDNLSKPRFADFTFCYQCIPDVREVVAMEGS